MGTTRYAPYERAHTAVRATICGNVNHRITLSSA